ncbi:hypothetical protein HYFRA_00005952 [Hymenoscyphus fraxineus]|uniref:Uncharacterized protein n=1 Tax=Hymenoscyphus fraxineus TaxID=746836 RepID=A0A9N9KUV8_9HELO|nr:hypothetical protein HYFRA_00005952 [Hymenoscyphus fraxineus]
MPAVDLGPWLWGTNPRWYEVDIDLRSFVSFFLHRPLPLFPWLRAFRVSPGPSLMCVEGVAGMLDISCRAEKGRGIVLDGDLGIYKYFILGERNGGFSGGVSLLLSLATLVKLRVIEEEEEGL